jgi:hypothetical protein
MVKCIFTDGAECCKCVICNHELIPEGEDFIGELKRKEI